MNKKYQTELFERIHAEVAKIKIVDCHEHLETKSQLPKGNNIHVGRFFTHYASSDLVSAGMPVAELEDFRSNPEYSPQDRWTLAEPWYRKTWNTAYCESLRIALQDIYDVEDFSVDTVDDLASKMQEKVKPGITREIFDKAGIDFATNQNLGENLVFCPEDEPDSFMRDINNNLSELSLFQDLRKQFNGDWLTLDEYVGFIDDCFEKYAHLASAFKTGHAYWRPIFWDDVSKNDAEKIFGKVIKSEKELSFTEKKPLEDFLMHYLCRKCGEYQLRMKFHTGLQEGNGNTITNSRAASLNNLFLMYPDTHFDIYHISYPYQDELTCLAKMFPNVSVNFCWMWIINPAAGRRALSEMLDTVPANKIHGFGGDYIFVEGSYGHSVIARREISRVLCEKIEEGRYSEEYALQVADMMLRENAIENFFLGDKRHRQLSGHLADTKAL